MRDNARTVESELPDIFDWRDHQDLSGEELDVLCRAWLRYQSETSASDDHPDWWAALAVMELNELPLEVEWRVIRRLSELGEEANEEAISMIGIGPIESLLWRHDEQAMDLIEPTADDDAPRQPLLWPPSRVGTWHPLGAAI